MIYIVCPNVIIYPMKQTIGLSIHSENYLKLSCKLLRIQGHRNLRPQGLSSSQVRTLIWGLFLTRAAIAECQAMRQRTNTVMKPKEKVPAGGVVFFFFLNVVQAGIKLTLLLPQPPEHWDDSGYQYDGSPTLLLSYVVHRLLTIHKADIPSRWELKQQKSRHHGEKPINQWKEKSRCLSQSAMTDSDSITFLLPLLLCWVTWQVMGTGETSTYHSAVPARCNKRNRKMRRLRSLVYRNPCLSPRTALRLWEVTESQTVTPATAEDASAVGVFFFFKY